MVPPDRLGERLDHVPARRPSRAGTGGGLHGLILASGLRRRYLPVRPICPCAPSVPIMGRVTVLPGLDLALSPSSGSSWTSASRSPSRSWSARSPPGCGQPPIVGYLVAGVVIGPFTPGFVGDQEQIGQLAELGVVLLLFALGVEFSLRELAPGAADRGPGRHRSRSSITAVAGAAVAILLGLDAAGAVVIGSAIAISSTLVVLKILVERGELDSLHGRAAIGWMVVQDLVTIVAHRRCSSRSPAATRSAPLLLAAGRGPRSSSRSPTSWGRGSCRGSSGPSAASGRRSCSCSPCSRRRCSPRSSSSAVFGLSLALGAFVAGLIVSESDLSHQAAGEIIPFRDLFAVLFFVSVGMLLDPAALVARLAGAAGPAGGRRRASRRPRAPSWVACFGLPLRSAILLGATIAQVGEFSFLLAEQALRARHLIDARGYNLVLGTAVLSHRPDAARSCAARPSLGDAHRASRGRWCDPPVRRPAPRRRAASSRSRRGPGSPGDRRPRRRPRGPRRRARRAGARLPVRRRGPRPARPGRARRPWARRRCTATRRARRSSRARAWSGRACWWSRSATRCRPGWPWSGPARSTRASRSWPGRGGGRRSDALRGLGVARLADPEVEAALELARATLARMGVSGPEQTAIALGPPAAGVRRRGEVRVARKPAGRRLPPEASDDPGLERELRRLAAANA